MNSRSMAVATAISKVIKKHKKFYSFPTEKRLTELVNEYHGYGVSERTMRRDIKELKDESLIMVKRRTRWDKSGRRVFTSNLYTMGKKFFKWLIKMEDLTKDLFSHFHRPKLAVNQLQQKHASLSTAASIVDKVLKCTIEGKPSPALFGG